MSEINIGVLVPDEQRIEYKITPLPGRLMSLRAIGGQIEALGKLLKALAREDDRKSKLDAYCLGIETDVAGAVTFSVLLAPRLPGGGAVRPAALSTVQTEET